jgi:2-desacetyl-2-hydroxyethyl bacteriochlorophyllide A dehydrogenase
MKAFQLVATGKPGQFQMADVAVPVPGPEEVVVRVRGCGLNHLDLWLEEGGLPIPIELPRIPGCEIAGEVETVGRRVMGWKRGDRVVVQSNLFCGRCEFCGRGEESLCLNGELLGVQRDGGLAEFVLVPARALVRLPDSVEYNTAAALGLAGTTALHMLTARATVKPEDWVLVMGAASGVGSAAIQIARHFGARVISTASTEAKRELAMELGAEAVVDLETSGWPAEVRQLTGKHGVDLVVEHIGGEVLEHSFQCLARGGTIVTCGATTGRAISLNLWPFFAKQQRLIGSYGRNRSDLEKCLVATVEGWLRPVIDTVLPLERAEEGFHRLRERKVLGKIICVPGQVAES